MTDHFDDLSPGLDSPSGWTEVVDVGSLSADHVFDRRPRFLWVEITGSSGNLIYRLSDGGDAITKIVTMNGYHPIRAYSVVQTSTVTVVHGEGG